MPSRGSRAGKTSSQRGTQEKVSGNQSIRTGLPVKLGKGVSK